jgi:predicted transcriptional regulator
MAKKAGRSKREGRVGDQFVVRLPDGMRDRIAAIAADTKRSMNTIIVHALALQLENVERDLEDQIAELWRKVETLESKVRELDGQINIRIEE